MRRGLYPESIGKKGRQKKTSTRTNPFSGLSLTPEQAENYKRGKHNFLPIENVEKHIDMMEKTGRKKYNPSRIATDIYAMEEILKTSKEKQRFANDPEFRRLVEGKMKIPRPTGNFHETSAEVEKKLFEFFEKTTPSTRIATKEGKNREAIEKAKRTYFNYVNSAVKLGIPAETISKKAMETARAVLLEESSDISSKFKKRLNNEKYGDISSIILPENTEKGRRFILEKNKSTVEEARKIMNPPWLAETHEKNPRNKLLNMAKYVAENAEKGSSVQREAEDIFNKELGRKTYTTEDEVFELYKRLKKLAEK